MYYTRAGDTGTTTIYGCDQRLSKSSAIAEALGALDEATSFLGLLRAKAVDVSLPDSVSVAARIEEVQNHLFTIQAELAGAEKYLTDDASTELEKHVDAIARVVPPITTFVVPGGSELSALTDVARTIVRRAERRVVTVAEEGIVTLAPATLAYLNRLSSFLFILARYLNREEGIDEHAPVYDK
ncbi:MAG: cob(I)yrinic acid a,c-diamide adenosyltransferase [Candidatus Yonathbacteria bacterium]|nr:cob(I)yrinic acid a,c-diamide adenosyltransferase [Candidatus Yonathbacteria bacterium]